MFRKQTKKCYKFEPLKRCKADLCIKLKCRWTTLGEILLKFSIALITRMSLGQWRWGSSQTHGWASCDRNYTVGAFLPNRRGGLVTQAGLDDSFAGKGWCRESIITPGGSWGLKHQRISIKEVSVWGLGRGRRMVKVAEEGGSPYCPNSDWEQEEGSGLALCLHLLWRSWLLGGDGEGGGRDGEAVDSSSCVNKVSGT